MEKHLAARYGATRAEIQLMEHRLPTAIEVFDEKVKLNDEKLYVLIPDLPPAAGTTSVSPLPDQTKSGIPLLPRQTSEEVKP